MNKITKIILPVFIISLFVGMTFAQADYNVTVGTVLTFDVVESNWDISIGPNNAEASGWSFEGESFNTTDQFTVNVTSADALGVDWNMSAGDKFDLGSNSGWDALGLLFVLVYPLLFTMGVGTWDQATMDLGPEVMTLFFLEPYAFSEFFYNISQEDLINETITDSAWTFDQAAGNFVNSSSVAVFDWVLNGQYVNASTNTDYSGNYRYKIAFDKTTGALKGYKMAIDYSGTVQGSIVDIVINQHVEQVGYDLGDFFFTAGGFTFPFPGFGWIGAALAISSLFVLAVVIRKRK